MSHFIHTKPTQKVGFVVKTHGFDGRIKIEFTHPHILPEFKAGTFILLILEGQWVPFCIEHCQDQSIFKLQLVQNHEQALRLIGAEVCMFSETLKDSEPEANSNFEGFELQDQEGNTIGHVIALESYPGHQVLEVMHKKGPILVPFHPSLVRLIDEAQKRIVMEMPEGLLDL